MYQRQLIFLTLISIITGFNCDLDISFKKLIYSSLEPFKQGITQSMIDKLKSGPLLCLITIKDHQVVSDCMEKQHDCFMRSIAKHLPNLEFVLNYDDRPRVDKHQCGPNIPWSQCACDSNYSHPAHASFIQSASNLFNEKLPLFSQATIPDCFLDILFPSFLHFDYRYRIHRSILWEKKKFEAIWRGSSTGGHCYTFEECRSFHRQRLVELCSKIDDCDAGFSRIVQCEEEVCQDMNQTYGTKKLIVQMSDMPTRKIILDIDGNSYSGRYPFLLETGSAVFKMFAFHDVVTSVTIPWVHYVPVKMDLSDFQERLQWARNNDEALRLIGEQAQKRVKQVLNQTSYQCYVINLLQKYHSLFKTSNKVLTNDIQP